METVWWIVSLGLMLIGLFGAIFPVVPDSLFILAGAVLHHFTIRPERSVGWWTLGVLTFLCVLAHAVDFTAGAMGGRKFGASRWGAVGGMIGGIVGTIFFFPFGLLLGPVIGALGAEIIFAGRQLGPAARSSWGTLLGTTAGLIGKLIIDVSMVAIFVFVVWFHPH